MDVQARFSVLLKVSKVVKWSCIFVRSIRGLPNFLAIPIMNPLMRVHDNVKSFARINDFICSSICAISFPLYSTDVSFTAVWRYIHERH